MDLVPYDQARLLLAEARTVDDVKDIMDKAAAMAEYRRRAGDRSLEVDAIEIRMFAVRRLGQMIAAQKAGAGLNQGSRGQLRGRDASGGAASEPPEDSRPTLKQAGIDKHLSSHAQKVAALAPAEFESKLASWRAAALTEDRVTTNLLQVGRQEEQREARRTLAQALADTSEELTGEKTFPCFYADPAYARKAGIGDRAYENHYPTEKWNGILEIMKKLAPRLQPNAWGFIWIPRAHMLALHPVSYKVQIDDGSIHEVVIKTPLIWAIARAAGMDDYSTCFVWTKTDEEHPDEHGTFLLARDQDEILCLYKKGDGLPRPEMHHIYGSNHRERSRPLGHSVKPPFYRTMIADMVGCDKVSGKPLPVLELFARFDKDHPLPENWEAWGNQSQGESECATPADSNAAPGMDSPAAAATTATSPAAGTRTTTDLTETTTSPETHSAAATAHAENSFAIVPGRLHTVPDPEHLRWEGEGGRVRPDDEAVIVKPLRSSRAGAA